MCMHPNLLDDSSYSVHTCVDRSMSSIHNCTPKKRFTPRTHVHTNPRVVSILYLWCGLGLNFSPIQILIFQHYSCRPIESIYCQNISWVCIWNVRISPYTSIYQQNISWVWIWIVRISSHKNMWAQNKWINSQRNPNRKNLSSFSPSSL